jgi:hypothetical protein
MQSSHIKRTRRCFAWDIRSKLQQQCRVEARTIRLHLHMFRKHLKKGYPPTNYQEGRASVSAYDISKTRRRIYAYLNKNRTLASCSRLHHSLLSMHVHTSTRSRWETYYSSFGSQKKVVLTWVMELDLGGIHLHQ